MINSYNTKTIETVDEFIQIVIETIESLEERCSCGRSSSIHVCTCERYKSDGFTCTCCQKCEKI